MKSFGLNVVEPSRSDRQAWFDILEENTDELVGDVFPAEQYNMIVEHLEDFRR